LKEEESRTRNFRARSKKISKLGRKDERCGGGKKIRGPEARKKKWTKDKTKVKKTRRER